MEESETSELVGEFKVVKITHDIDSFDGDFQSTIECQLTDAEFINPEEFNIEKLNQNTGE